MATFFSAKTVATAFQTHRFRRHEPVKPVSLAATIVATFLCLAMVLPAQAQRGLPLVRDAEIEGLIKDYSSPIFKAAGLKRGSVEVYLLNRTDYNAFVAGRRMFFHLGAISTAETPSEIKGVLAHETGHIIGGHLTRLRDRMDKAQILSALTTLLGVGAIAAGGDGGAAAGQALILGGNQAIRSDLLAYRRSEEDAADQAAVRLLNATKQTSRGLLTTFERFQRGNLFSNANPYLRSHPLPRERISQLEQIVRQSPYYNATDSASEQLRHDMARAKIAAYTGGGTEVRRMFRTNLNSAPARYGDAIATFLAGDTRGALGKIDQLITEQPGNAYLHEMRGEILLRSGRAADAIKPFQQAIKLDRHDAGILRIQLGHAYQQSGNKSLLDDAIRELKAGLGRDRNNARGYDYLARAYGAQGNTTLAIAATAEARMLQGRLKEAKQFALRAQPNLKRGSPEWLRLQDIIEYKPGK